MTANPAGRLTAIAWTTFRGCLSGRRAIALILLGALYPAVVIGLAAASSSGANLVAESEQVFSALFLPIMLLIVALVLGVAQFRTEIEEDTLVYLTSRSVPRATIVVGKYAGTVLAAAIVLVPSALVGSALGVAYNLAPSASSQGLYAAVLAMSLAAIAAYTAFFLLLGLLTRHALPIGLFYGFIWETFVSQLPGPIKQATIVYYLRALGASYVTSGPLASPAPIPPASVALGVVGLVALVIVLTSACLEWIERRPVPSPQ
jgi:ABC-2 type transport system permease protein